MKVMSWEAINSFFKSSKQCKNFLAARKLIKRKLLLIIIELLMLLEEVPRGLSQCAVLYFRMTTRDGGHG